MIGTQSLLCLVMGPMILSIVTQAIRNKGVRALIPPREGAVEWPDGEEGDVHGPP